MKKVILIIGLVGMALLAGCGEKTEAAKPALQTAAPASPGGFFKKPPGPVEPAASPAAAPVVVAPSPAPAPAPVTAPAPDLATAKTTASAPAASPPAPAKPAPKAAPATQKTVLAEAPKKQAPPTVTAAAPVPAPALGPVEICSKKANAFLKEVCIAKECVMNSQHAQCIALSKERGGVTSNVN